MKRSNKYEEIIGNKLNSISAPDVTSLWSSMEDLLDKEMPQQEKKKRGIGTWWSTTNIMIAASLFIAVGSVYTLCHVSGKTPAGKLTVEAIRNSPATSGTEAEVSVGKLTTDDSPTASPAPSTVEETVAETKLAAEQGEEVFAGKSAVIKSETVVVPSGDEAATSSIIVDNNGSTVANNEVPAMAATEVVKEEAVANSESRDVTVQALESASPLTVNLPAVFTQQSVRNLNASSLPATIAKKKKPTIYLDKGVSAGLAFNLPAAINNQVKNDLDMSGKKNRWQDYIPSVYAQLHLSKKLYVQAEFQPVTAQYTPNFTLYNRIDELNPDEKEQKVVQLNKLYYTSLPLSVHYKTPLKNVTVGLGVQYSRLRKVILQDKEYYHLIQAGGVFKVEERKNDVAVKDPEDVRSHNTGDVVDSVARSIRREDWRLLADVGYQYKGFNLGVRYTSGVGNYINSNFTNLPVKDRNESLQVYLRFNLFDNRKK